jgi:NTE family protein
VTDVTNATRSGGGTLASVPRFHGVRADALRSLEAGAGSVVVHAGEWLFRSGDPADCLYVVRSGRVRIVVEGDEGPRILREVGAGAAIGELALLTGSNRSASVQAVRDSELVVLSAATFDELLGEDPAFAGAVARELALQLQASGRLEGPAARARVFSVVPLDRAVDAGRLAAVLERELARHGSVTVLGGGDDLVGEPSAALARAESDHDTVVLLAGADGDGWDAFCRRQGDRVVLVAGPDTPVTPEPAGCDLVLLAPMPSGVVARWLATAEPRTHHLVYEAAFEIGAARAARRIAGRSLGLVLSGGGARGLAHIGVIGALTDAGFEVDRLGGCSMGAFVAGMSALGLDESQIHEVCRDELVRRAPFNDWTIPRVSLIRSRKAGRMLHRVFGELQVEELPRPLFTVSADLISSTTVVHRRGPLIEAVGASMSIPGLVPPLPRHGRLLVDGGVLNNLPVDLMDEAREGPVVAVDVVRRMDAVPRDEEPRLPTIMETLSRATVLGSVERAERNRALATLVVGPDVHDVGLREFSALDRAVAAGREAAERALEAGGADALREALAGVR